jgi:hypothetical protein
MVAFYNLILSITQLVVLEFSMIPNYFAMKTAVNIMEHIIEVGLAI